MPWGPKPEFHRHSLTQTHTQHSAQYPQINCLRSERLSAWLLSANRSLFPSFFQSLSFFVHLTAASLQGDITVSHRPPPSPSFTCTFFLAFPFLIPMSFPLALFLSTPAKSYITTVKLCGLRGKDWIWHWNGVRVKRFCVAYQYKHPPSPQLCVLKHVAFHPWDRCMHAEEYCMQISPF